MIANVCFVIEWYQLIEQVHMLFPCIKVMAMGISVVSVVDKVYGRVVLMRIKHLVEVVVFVGSEVDFRDGLYGSGVCWETGV